MNFTTSCKPFFFSRLEVDRDFHRHLAPALPCACCACTHSVAQRRVPLSGSLRKMVCPTHQLKSSLNHDFTLRRQDRKQGDIHRRHRFDLRRLTIPQPVATPPQFRSKSERYLTNHVGSPRYTERLREYERLLRKKAMIRHRRNVSDEAIFLSK